MIKDALTFQVRASFLRRILLSCRSAAPHGGELDLRHVVDEVHLVGELVEGPEAVEVVVGEVPADDRAEILLELLVGEGGFLRQDLADGRVLVRFCSLEGRVDAVVDELL